ncbi:hypothetical protein ABEW60_15070 [Paenibacillus jamilae]|uniref:hypothetical protein n=1 Tax=Paenibacillus TaxID=44249 RepID=UPI00117EF81E|nr:hypothetical protein [Paenibacillus peoriae]
MSYRIQKNRIDGRGLRHGANSPQSLRTDRFDCLPASRSIGIHYNKASIDYKDEASTSGERKGRKGVDDYG